eukprot:366481-Chlamydomonas_euryale.AAC.4
MSPAGLPGAVPAAAATVGVCVLESHTIAAAATRVASRPSGPVCENSIACSTASKRTSRGAELRCECGELRCECGELRCECGELRYECGELRYECGEGGGVGGHLIHNIQVHQAFMQHKTDG